ncbi:MAG: hypothetical protein J5942_01110 [Prevotella sp.]|nr:hypothetical protein [Prevotella sp.]
MYGTRGTEDKRTKEQEKRKRERKTEGQKDRRTEKKINGTEDRRTEEQEQGGKRNGRQKDRRTEKRQRKKKTEGQRNRKKEKGTEDRRTKEQKKRKRERKTGRQKNRRQKTEEQKQVERGTGARGHADWKKPVNFLRMPWSNLTEPLEQCSSYPVALLRGCWRKFTEGVGITPECMERCRLGNAVTESTHIIKISATWHLIKTFVEQEA